MNFRVPCCRAEGRFLQLGGLRIECNTRFTAGNRVCKLTLADGRTIVQDGAIVSGAPNVSVVTNSCTARGGDATPR